MLQTMVTGRFRGAWAATTFYRANDMVTSGGLLYAANADFTSGGSFSASNWTALTSLQGTDAWLPTGAIDQTINDRLGGTASGLTSGQLRLVGGCVIPAGRAPVSITFCSNNVAGASMTNQWFCLVDKVTRNVLGTTLDDTSTAWGASALKTLLLATTIGGSTPGAPWTASADTPVYLGCCVAGTTPPNLSAASGVSAALGAAPILAGSSTASLTTPGSIPATVAAPSAIGTIPIAWVS